MASNNKPVMRHGRQPEIENVALPKWDRDGKLVSRPVKARVKQTITDVSNRTFKAPTVTELESIREDAYNEGFEQGFESGLAQGKREGQEKGKDEGYAVGLEAGRTDGLAQGIQQALTEEQLKTDQKLSVFDGVTDALKNQIAVEQTEIEQALMALSMRIARQVLQDEVKLHPEHIQRLVHAAVQSLPNADDKLSLHVNPQEVELVRSFAENHWSVQSDASVTPGGCKIKSEFSYIDYTMEHRFDTTVSHFMTHLGDKVSESAKSPISSDALLSDQPPEPISSEVEGLLETTQPNPLDSSATVDVEKTEESEPRGTEPSSFNANEEKKKNAPLPSSALPKDELSENIDGDPNQNETP